MKLFLVFSFCLTAAALAMELPSEEDRQIPVITVCDSETPTTPCCPFTDGDGKGGDCFPNAAYIMNSNCCQVNNCCAFKCSGGKWYCDQECGRD